MTKRSGILWGLLLLFGWTEANATEPGASEASGKSVYYCDCYWDADCGDGGDCTGYHNCVYDGKFDGNCATGVEIASDASTGIEAEPEELAAAVDLYFRAYLKTARKGEGIADAALFARAESVWLGRDNERLHGIVKEAINEALDTVLGFDFTYPSTCWDRSQPGNLRAVPRGSIVLLQAMREGFVNGILSRDPSAFDQPLAEFWRRYPRFEPEHTGRYYPHGHEGEATDPYPVQSKALRKILNRVLRLMKI